MAGRCRACLEFKESFNYFLCKNVSQEMYRFCTTVQIVSSDKLPKSICDICYELITKFSQFKQTCIQSNIILTSSYTEKHLEFETIKDEVIGTEIKIEYSEDTIADNDNFDKAVKSEDELNIKLENRSLIPNHGISEIRKEKQKRKRIQNCNRTKYKYKCDKCNMHFVHLHRFEAHKLVKHEGKSASIHCNICNIVFNSWQVLDNHYSNHHSVISMAQLQCPICGLLCKTRSGLKQHQQSQHLRTPQCFVCDLCGKEFKSEITLKNHLLTHEANRQRTHECDMCGAKFYTQNAVAQHRLKRHTNRQFVCDICSKCYRDKRTLATHISVVHEGKKPFKCSVCSKTYGTKRERKLHMRYHLDERPYPCSYCPKKFIARSTLRDHEKIHTGVKPYECKLCTQAFAQKGSFNRHVKLHAKGPTPPNAVQEGFSQD